MLPSGPQGFPQPSENINKQPDQVTDLEITGRASHPPSSVGGVWLLASPRAWGLGPSQLRTVLSDVHLPSHSPSVLVEKLMPWRELAGRSGPHPGELGPPAPCTDRPLRVRRWARAQTRMSINAAVGELTHALAGIKSLFITLSRHQNTLWRGLK